MVLTCLTQEAEILELQVMETRRQILGAEHLETLTSMANLASTYQSQARYDEAETFHKTVLSLRQRILGDAHADTAQSMLNLAVTQEYLRLEQVLKAGSPPTPSDGEAHDTGRWRRHVAGMLGRLKGKFWKGGSRAKGREA